MPDRAPPGLPLALAVAMIILLRNRRPMLPAPEPRFSAQMALFHRMLRVGELMCLAGNKPTEPKRPRHSCRPS